MKLTPISEHPDHLKILWDLLAERTPEQSISHKGMPTWEDHVAFVGSPPYTAWYLIDMDGFVVGSTYLTHSFEIGISVFHNCRRIGIGSSAVKELMRLHGPRRYLANINPANEASKRMWAKLGFTKIQETYSNG